MKKIALIFSAASLLMLACNSDKKTEEGKMDEKTTETKMEDKEKMEMPDSATMMKKYTNMAYKQWINDMYWLVAPLKIKDEGVRLRYLGEDTTQTGIASDVIELKFDSVGVTPQNMYKLWVV